MNEIKMPMPTPFERRVDKLEQDFFAGLKEIKELIVSEIRELKTEQLADIRATVDRVERTLKEDHRRLADDQRRLWDKVNEAAMRPELAAALSRIETVEGRDKERIGTSRTLLALWVGISSLIGAIVTAVVDALLFRH